MIQTTKRVALVVVPMAAGTLLFLFLARSLSEHTFEYVIGTMLNPATIFAGTAAVIAYFNHFISHQNSEDIKTIKINVDGRLSELICEIERRAAAESSLARAEGVVAGSLAQQEQSRPKPAEGMPTCTPDH